jgi:hypothetical protein
VDKVLGIVIVFGSALIGFLAISPVGRALADRLRHKGIEPGMDPAELDALRDELAGLRHQVGELAERQDFTERLLAQSRDKGLLAPPKER